MEFYSSCPFVCSSVLTDCYPENQIAHDPLYWVGLGTVSRWPTGSAISVNDLHIFDVNRLAENIHTVHFPTWTADTTQLHGRLQKNLQI